MLKRDFSSLTLREAMQIIAATQITPWEPTAAPRPPSDILAANFQRLDASTLGTRVSRNRLR